MKSATELFLSELSREVNLYNTAFNIKASVGDSVNNNRVPSVRQLIRYFDGSIFHNDMYRQLSGVYDLLLSKKLLRKVRRNNNRTDAYDVNEFITALNRYVLKNPALKGQVSKTVNQLS